MIHNAFLIANKIVNDPKYRPLLSIIKGVRNGIVYGCKIRFPHALVMTFLFRKGTLLQKAKIIFMATKTHAMNLASFVVIYKALRFIFKLFFQEITQLHTLIAAFAGGYFVFGERNNINEQINMYLLSRILFGLTRLAQEKSLLPRSKSNPLFSFSIFGAVVWAIVLWLFEYHIHVLQPSLQASMTYLYHDSNKWNSFRNFLIHNK